ncbi:MAG: (Fe-S)-binding protein [Dehalococcoidia bacterium]|nr:(Fe-S)-binding protein [Dehalococcoidia bacterium]
MHVALFDPCYLAAVRPGDAAHATRVLEALGDTVTLIDGRCCGQPAYNSGFRDEAKSVGRELLKAARGFDAVVTTSGSCTAMVRHYLPPMFPGDRRAGAERIAGTFREFGDYVAHHPGIDDVAFRLDGTVAVHEGCHTQRELGLAGQTHELLRRVQGLEVRPLAHPEECCGFGGSFAAKLPEISVAMMTAKLGDVTSTGARVLVSPDFSCLMHLEAGARGMGVRIECWTLAELLSRAMG